MEYTEIVVLDKTITLPLPVEDATLERARTLLSEIDNEAFKSIEDVPHDVRTEGTRIIFYRTDAHFG